MVKLYLGNGTLRSNMKFGTSQPQMVRLQRIKEQTYWLNASLQIGSSGLTLAMTLTLHLQGKMWRLLYLSQNWPDCFETKSKHIHYNSGLKWDYQVWPWPWPWLWIVMIKYLICYISAKNSLIATKRKTNISIELQASSVIMALKGEVWGSDR